MNKHSRTKNTALGETLPILDIEYEEYTDGTCGGRIVGVQGEMFATDELTFFSGMNWLVSQIGKIEADAQKRGGGTRQVDVGMQGEWIDGDFCVRFLPSPNWGVSFAAQADLQKWLTHIIKVVCTPKTIKTND